MAFPYPPRKGRTWRTIACTNYCEGGLTLFRPFWGRRIGHFSTFIKWIVHSFCKSSSAALVGLQIIKNNCPLFTSLCPTNPLTHDTCHHSPHFSPPLSLICVVPTQRVTYLLPPTLPLVEINGLFFRALVFFAVCHFGTIMSAPVTERQCCRC